MTLIQGGPAVNVPQLLATGAVDVGVGSNSFIVMNLAQQKTPVKAVAAFMQKDPQVLIAHPNQGINGIADMKGRPILLNIWAKWCAPCLVEMPVLNKLQAETAPGTLAVVAVAVDEPDPAKVRDFLANRRWDALKPYLDPKNVFAKALDIKAIPVSLLIDKNGFALVRVDAPVDWYSDEAIRLLKRTIL